MKKEKGQAALAAILIIVVVMAGAVIGFVLGLSLGEEQGLRELGAGTPIHDCEISLDGTNLTFFIGDQQLNTKLSMQYPRPADLHTCTDYNTNGHKIYIYSEDVILVDGYHYTTPPATE